MVCRWTVIPVLVHYRPATLHQWFKASICKMRRTAVFPRIQSNTTWSIKYLQVYTHHLAKRQPLLCGENWTETRNHTHTVGWSYLVPQLVLLKTIYHMKYIHSYQIFNILLSKLCNNNITFHGREAQKTQHHCWLGSSRIDYFKSTRSRNWSWI